MCANNTAIVPSQLGSHSQSTRDRVQDYLNAGWEVSIHQAPITQDGWTGAGFTVIDPSTGAGGYLIEGGSNGGALLLALVVLLSLVFIDFVAVYYASALIVDAISLAAGYIVSSVLEGYLSPSSYVTLTGLAFLGSVVIAALLLAAGYVLSAGIFLVPLFAAVAFIYAAVSNMFRLASPPS